MSQSHDHKKVYITENEAQEMLNGIVRAIEVLDFRLNFRCGPTPPGWGLREVIDGLMRSHKIGAQILADVAGLGDD